MAFKLKAIKPKVRGAVNFARITQAVKATMEKARDGALDDYEKCTDGWEHEVAFEVVPLADGFIVGTEDEVFSFVDDGTDPHQIAPRPGKTLRFYAGGAPKTRPHIIGSGPGKRGDRLVYTRKPVQHPGTEARGFTEEIHKKWEDRLPDLMLANIKKAID